MKIDGRKVLALRNERCWSQDHLAMTTGLSVRTIQRIEKGGSASLESMKALASVFEMTTPSLHITNNTSLIEYAFVMRLGWIISFLVAIVLLGTWVIDILIPTLKGGDFNYQYEINGNFRYLDFACISFFMGVIMLCLGVVKRVVDTKPLIFQAISKHRN
jgi:transcriptional regulator with XRE-family HTH domain